MPDATPKRHEMVVCVLNEPDHLHDVLAAMLEAGVQSSTVIESQGMGRILAHDVPAFAGFRQLFAGSKPYNHTIFAVVSDPQITEKVFELVTDVLSTTPDEHPGILFSLPVSHFRRLSEK